MTPVFETAFGPFFFHDLESAQWIGRCMLIDSK